MNQRAVYDGIGFIHILSKEIWDGHPCCAVGASMEFVNELPNTYRAFMRALIEATVFASKPENRQPMASVMALPPYLNQPSEWKQILTGTIPRWPRQCEDRAWPHRFRAHSLELLREFVF